MLKTKTQVIFEMLEKSKDGVSIDEIAKASKSTAVRTKSMINYLQRIKGLKAHVSNNRLVPGVKYAKRLKKPQTEALVVNAKPQWHTSAAVIPGHFSIRRDQISRIADPDNRLRAKGLLANAVFFDLCIASALTAEAFAYEVLS